MADITTPPTRTLRVSVVQACSAAYSLEDTLKKLERLTWEAKRDNSQLAVFPEAFIGGYPRYSTFGMTVGDHTLEGRNEFLRYQSNAIRIPSPALSRIEAISKDTGVFLVVSVIEYDNGTLYCTTLFIDPNEGYIAKHRKIKPTGPERVIWAEGGGDTLPVLERTFKSSRDQNQTVTTKISATICWENYMPLLRTFYYQQGTQIYCAPTIFDHPDWKDSMTHIAVEGRCFVLSASQYAKHKDYPSDHPGPKGQHQVDAETVMIGGGSMIISPFGKILAGPLYDQEGVLTAEIDLDDHTRGKFDLDVVGHSARPDIFHFKAHL